MFERDLEESTEVVLDERLRHVEPVRRPASTPVAAGALTGSSRWRRWRRKGRGGSSGKAAAGALRLGNTMGAALTAKRPLGAAEAPTLITGGLVPVGFGALAAWWPALLAYPVAGLAAWLGMSLLVAAGRTRSD